MAKGRSSRGGGKGLRWPTGPVSKAQWRFLYATKNPATHKWAKPLSDRGKALGPKVHFRSLPDHQKLGPHINQKLR